MLTFLHAACGNVDKAHTTREFAGAHWQEVRMDVAGIGSPQIVSSLLDMRMLDPESFDAAFTARSLERLYSHEVGLALGNLLRILKQDGYLIVVCADLQLACSLVAEDKLLEPAYESPAGPVSPLDIIYGYRPAIAAGQTLYARKCGFTIKALIGTLSQVGFASIWGTRIPQTFTIAAIACKSKHPEAYLKKLAATHFG